MNGCVSFRFATINYIYKPLDWILLVLLKKELILTDKKEVCCGLQDQGGEVPDGKGTTRIANLQTGPGDVPEQLSSD